MPSEIAIALAQVVANGLRRKSIVSCSTWAEKCRMVGKPWPGPYSFKHFPWARAMHDCNADKWVCMKSAQVGVTEVGLNVVFYTIDIKRMDCLYLLPSKSNAGEFSAGRFDPALELSPYLNTLFNDVQNVGHKRAGATNLYVRGTRSRADLLSIPSALIIFDELDEMSQKNLSLAEQRQAGQQEPRQIRMSTPTTSGRGIDLEFQESTKEHFFFRCPCCSRMTELIFPDCLVVAGASIHDPKISESYFQCKECKGVLHHETKADWLEKNEWVPQAFQGNWPGFHINGLYSSAKLRTAPAIAMKVMKAREDESEEQELYNSILGKPHEVKGARIEDADIINCKRGYTLRPLIQAGSITTLGVDQGNQLHFWIDLWIPIGNTNNSVDVNMQYKPKTIDMGSVYNFEDLDLLMKRWQIRASIIDANPDKRSALDFANRFSGHVYLCFYAENIKSRNISVWPNEPTISVDRTAWLDMSLGRFRRGTILLPNDITEEAQKHLKAPVRKPEKDKNGNPIARYITGERVADHLAHARNYSEIALQFAVGSAENQDVHSPR